MWVFRANSSVCGGGRLWLFITACYSAPNPWLLESKTCMVRFGEQQGGVGGFLVPRNA